MNFLKNFYGVLRDIQGVVLKRELHIYCIFRKTLLNLENGDINGR